jgi:hypothetical protein
MQKITTTTYDYPSDDVKGSRFTDRPPSVILTSIKIVYILEIHFIIRNTFYN